MTNLEVREALKRMVQERGESLSGLSRLLGRNRAYLQQFVERGSPVRLEAKDREVLARYFGIDEEALGGPIPGPANKIVRVPRLAVQASAGAGSHVDREFATGSYRFDEAWLRQVSRAKPEELSIITVRGDSMATTLMDGDDVLVDHADAAPSLRDGIYVLRRDDTLMVKRLALAPTSGTVTISSDNPAYPTWPDCPLASIDVLGRVVWAGRRFG